MFRVGQSGGRLTAAPLKIRIFAIILVMASIATGQPDTLWTNYYNRGQGEWAYTSCERLIQTQDGGFVIGGSTYTPGANRQWYPAYYVVKTGSNGVEAWSRYFDISSRHDFLGGIAQGSNGQYFIAGGYQDGSWYANILNIDTNGDSLWSINIENGDFKNIISTRDGCFLACGDRNTQLVKINNAGGLLWRRNFNAGGNVLLFDITEIKDSSYVVVGRVWPSICLILKVNTEGEEQLIRTYNFSEGEEALMCVVETTDCGFLAGGWADDHSLLVRFDSEGDTVWAINDIPDFRNRINAIVPAFGGGYILVGGDGSRPNGYEIMRVDDLGEEVWEVGIEFDGASRFDEATSILALDDGGYLFGGNRRIRLDGGYSAGLIRTEPDTVRLPFVVQAITASHDFDSLEVDSIAFWECRLGNFGRRTVMIDSVSFAGDSGAFDIASDLPFWINPPDTVFIPVAFMPQKDTTCSATLSLWYPDDDGEHHAIEIELTGRGFSTNAVVNNENLLPTQIALESAWPNPFNGSTRINFSLPEAVQVSLQIVDIQGRLIQSLASGKIDAGRHSVVWNAEGVAAGLYFCKLTVNDQSATTKLILTK